jgi:[ribosomal protein S5]-alanine N-acetyltransferase
MSQSITVRRARSEDANATHRIRAHPAVCLYQPIQTRSVDELVRKLEERGTRPLTRRQAGKLQWTVLVEGDVAGWASVSIISRDHHVGAIGYSLHPRFWGNGIATHALRNVTQVATNPSGLALDRLEAVVAAENIASRRVLEKSGFAFEGIARGYLIIANRRVDHARYAWLREECHDFGTRTDRIGPNR